ncbi:MAG: heme-copper oxidase subunit III [Bacteroidia bacterium]
MDTAINVPASEKKLIPDGVIGMLFLLATEAMFFAGFISAYLVNRAGIVVWPPVGQPRLPIEITAINTLVLLSSAITVFLFGRTVKKNASITKNSKSLLIISIILGATFLLVQGSEWIKLIGFGLTAHSSIYGAFFYTIIGFHALHVIVGLIVLLYLLSSIIKPLAMEVKKNRIVTCSMYWYFIVGVWPILYILVYLS